MLRLNMHTLILSFLICSVFFSSESSESYVLLSPEQHAQEWVTYITSSLNPEEIQLAANLMCILYTNALIDLKVRQFIIPITRLNQEVRLRVFEYTDASEEVGALKVLLDRFSYVLGARTIYNTMLQTCLEQYNNNPNMILSNAIAALQIFGQHTLNDYANTNKRQTTERLHMSADLLQSHVEPLQAIANLHRGLADDEFMDYFTTNETTQNIVALATLDELLKNNSVALKNTENVLNVLDATTEYALQLIGIAHDIYKHHYAALYHYIMSENFDPSYAVLLFGMNDVLPAEYQTDLPHPDHVFEHALQMVKLYTHVEVIQ